MHIEADISAQYMDYFKSQLIQYEVINDDVQVNFDGGGFQDRHKIITDLVKKIFFDYPVSRRVQFWVFTGDNRPTSSINGQPLFSISGPRIQSDFVIRDPYFFCKKDFINSMIF